MGEFENHGNKALNSCLVHGLFQVSGMRVGVLRFHPGLDTLSSVGGSQGYPGLSQPHA